MDVAQVVAIVVLFVSLALLVMFLLRRQSTEIRELIFRLAQGNDGERSEGEKRGRYSVPLESAQRLGELIPDPPDKRSPQQAIEDHAVAWSIKTLKLDHNQQKIVELLIREPGKSRKEVAAELKVSLSTLDKCYERVYLKLEVRTKEEALKALLVRGIR